MTRRTFYLVVALCFLAGLALIVTFPTEALALLTVAVPISIASAVGSVYYLRRVYRRQPTPRSRFFGMLVETFYGLLGVGLWIGYLSVARVMERAVDAGTMTWALPAPPPTISAPISSLVVIAVFLVPLRFALEVWRVRRRSDSPRTLEETRDLDRDDP